jgi:hypothetical protein
MDTGVEYTAAAGDRTLRKSNRSHANFCLNYLENMNFETYFNFDNFPTNTLKEMSEEINLNIPKNSKKQVYVEALKTIDQEDQRTLMQIYRSNDPSEIEVNSNSSSKRTNDPGSPHNSNTDDVQNHQGTSNSSRSASPEPLSRNPRNNTSRSRSSTRQTANQRRRSRSRSTVSPRPKGS